MKISLKGLREFLKAVEVFLFLIAGPTAVFYYISTKWPPFLDISYHVVVTILVLQAGLSYWYSTSVFREIKFKPLPAAQNKPVPRATFIVVAYLPNELKIIEATILNILQKIKRPRDGIELIFVYNTPHMEELELKMRELTYKWPELILANAYGSRSKGENLNYAIDLASGEMIALFDADHLAPADCLERAWRWLDEGYDVVQGRCKIRNGPESFISSLVEPEFEVIYGIHHPSKSVIFDTALFGGSNGYWRSSALKKTKFSESMLTEDIDGTLRALLSGYRFANDRSIVATELAPTTIAGLWYQRKRWSQGWFQCSLKYQAAVLKTKYLNVRQKFLWTTLLSWRVTYDIISSLLFPILFAFWMRVGRAVLPLDPYIVFALIFTIFSGPYQAMVAYKNAASPRGSVFLYLNYAFLVWPYTLFRTMIHMVAIRDELTGERKWIVSKR